MASAGRTKAIICLGLVAVTLLAYEPIRHNDFVNYDDRAYITENPNVNGGITPQSVVWAFTKTYMANWYPLTWLSHMLDFEIYGPNPAGHHVTSVIIHIISSVLLFLVLLKMTGAIWPSAFTAAVFAIHPVHVESVAWAAERKDVLSGLFWILTMLAYVRYAEKPDFKRYSLVLVAFIMGIMSKPMVVTLPFVLLLLDYWPLLRFPLRLRYGGQVATKGGPLERFKKQKAGWLIIEKIPLLALSAVSCLITLFAQKTCGAVIALEKIPVDYRIANTFLSYIRYIGKTLWPARLAVLYPHPHKNPAGAVAIITALLFIFLTVICVEFGRRRKYLLTGWLWYVGTLVPVIGLIQVGSQGIADRYMYLPMTGLLIISAWGVKDIIAGRPLLKIAAAVSTGIILSLLLILTQIQVQYLQNSLTLFEHTLKVTEENAAAETYYGMALAQSGRFGEAEKHFKNALRINPESPGALNFLGEVMLNEGKFDEAVECFNQILNQTPQSPSAYYNLGMALAMTGKFDDAVNRFRKVIELAPDYRGVYKRAGMALLSAGKTNEAVEYLRKSLQINPEEAVVYVSLSIAYIKSGKIDLAIESWTRAKDLEPGVVGGLKNPAWVLVSAPDISAEDANNTILFAERLCEMTTYSDPITLDTLAAAYATGGRFDEAVKTSQKAIDAANAQNKYEFAGEINKRQELYTAGKRYIQN